jgi:hypothetical protein
MINCKGQFVPKTLSERQRDCYRSRRDHLISKLGGKFSDPRALQIDHVNGGGYAEFYGKHDRNWNRFYRDVLADQDGKYQVLCANCNWIKRAETHEQRKHFRRSYDSVHQPELFSSKIERTLNKTF